MKYRNNYFTIAAVHRFFDRHKVDTATAASLLVFRARLKKDTASALVNIWMENKLVWK